MPAGVAALRGGNTEDKQNARLKQVVGLSVALSFGVAAAVIALCPSHDSFEQFLTAAGLTATDRQRPGLLSTLAERLNVVVLAETRSWLLLRTGAHGGRRFVGAMGTWFRLPSLPALSFLAAPHKLLAILWAVGFLVGRHAPALTGAHALCSLECVRAGRPWVLLTSRLVHSDVGTLINSILLLISLGPTVLSGLGSERFAQLLLGAALAASVASLLWQVLGRSGRASAGGGSVAMGVIAANAALYPGALVNLFGLAMPYWQLLLLYVAFDAAVSGADLAAHGGGVAAGYALAQRWARPISGL